MGGFLDFIIPFKEEMSELSTFFLTSPWWVEALMVAGGLCAVPIVLVTFLQIAYGLLDMVGACIMLGQYITDSIAGLFWKTEKHQMITREQELQLNTYANDINSGIREICETLRLERTTLGMNNYSTQNYTHEAFLRDLSWQDRIKQLTKKAKQDIVSIGEIQLIIEKIDRVWTLIESYNLLRQKSEGHNYKQINEQELKNIVSSFKSALDEAGKFLDEEGNVSRDFDAIPEAVKFILKLEQRAEDPNAVEYVAPQQGHSPSESLAGSSRKTRQQRDEKT